MKLIKWITCLLFTGLLTGCSAELKDYQGTQPAFQLFPYFEGKTTAWGMVQDYTAQQTRRFHVTLVGTVKGDVLTLDEQFTYDDGEKETRIWTITRFPEGRYQGKADDIEGIATGREVGNALQWQYDFVLQYGEGKETTVSFDDWLYRQDENHLFNLTSIRKLGMEVGRVTLFFAKDAAK